MRVRAKCALKLTMGGKTRRRTHSVPFCASLLERCIAVVFLILGHWSLRVGPQITSGGVASLDCGAGRALLDAHRRGNAAAYLVTTAPRAGTRCRLDETALAPPLAP
ncbi:hypothetical protein D3260_00650 [Salinisphaera sp. Q1T1-3]|nr:hypothetical protein D3260_00650 [Salinisphaera sp. Q1T1-3]